MGKYAPLGDYLRKQNADSVPMRFDDIERIVGSKLPEKSQRQRTWWSNNPDNNVMTKVWLDAGFRTEQVDIDARRLVFRRVRPMMREGVLPASEAAGAVSAERKPHHPLFGALKGLLRVMPGTDLTKPAGRAFGRRVKQLVARVSEAKPGDHDATLAPDFATLIRATVLTQHRSSGE